jgi:hypothetical protein
MKHVLYGVITVSLLAILALGLMRTEQTHAQGGAVKITDAIPATSATGRIFQTSLAYDYRGGRVILAGDEHGTGRMYVDDNLYIYVTRPDSTVVTYTHFFDLNFSSVDLTGYFLPGNNQVEVRIDNVTGPGTASALWLVGLAQTSVTLPYQFVDTIPTFAVPAGSFFSRYAYVEYSGSGRLLLAANADGQGITSVNDGLLVQVWRPDGTVRRYSRDNTPLSVIDLTDYFQRGQNLVQLRLQNSGSSAGTGSFWLVHLPETPFNLPFEISPDIPTYSPPAGDVFGRYFWVNVDGGGKYFLSSTADGNGQLSVAGGFYLRVVHPDGSQVTFTQNHATSRAVDVSRYFEAGLNLVHARIRNTGTSVAAAPIYLTQSGTPLPMVALEAPGWSKEITAGFPGVNRGDGTVFFDQNFALDYQRGEAILSRYSDGQGIMVVDDRMFIDIVRPDNTTRSLTLSGWISPVRLTELLQVGRNEVRVRLQETGGDSSSTSLWFYNLLPIPAAPPIMFSDDMLFQNRGDGRDFFVRQAYINYDGNGSLILARFSDGSGSVYADDLARIWITHQDGTTRYHEYSYWSSIRSPQDLTHLFAIGPNLVWFILSETGGSSEASSTWLSQLPAETVQFPFSVTAGEPTGNRLDGLYYFGRWFYVSETGLNVTTFSQFADGTGNLSVDDELHIHVIRPDGSRASYLGRYNIPPVHFDSYLNIGINQVWVLLRETSGGSGASPIWISQIGPALTPQPTSTWTPTKTPVPSFTPTNSPTPTNTPTSTDTSTSTYTPTETPTLTRTPANTPTPTATPSVFPAIYRIQPNQGSNHAANDLHIHGLNFSAGASIRLGTTQLTQTTFVSSELIQAIVPIGFAPGRYNLTLTNPDGGSATLSNAYTVFDPATNDDLFANDYELWSEPAAPHAGAEARLYLLVRRQGGKQPLTNVTVRFFLGDPASGGTLIGDGAIPLLSPRSADTTTGVAWTPPAAGEYVIHALIDPDNAAAETYETNNHIRRSITVLPPAADQLAPRVESFAINGGALHTDERTVTLNLLASDPEPGSGVTRFLVVEYEFSIAANQWVPVRQSAWLDYRPEDAGHTWSLIPTSGLKYLQAWVADRAGNISLFPGKTYINYLPVSQRVATNQRKIYRLELDTGQTLSARLEPVSGDPDLYLWPPDHQTRPPWVSNLREGVDDLVIQAPVAGNYQVEVYGYTAAEFRLIVDVTSTVVAAAATSGVDPDKPLPAGPPLDNEEEPSGGFALNSPGQGQQPLYLPLVQR